MSCTSMDHEHESHIYVSIKASKQGSRRSDAGNLLAGYICMSTLRL